ncbi:MAG TPA: hypothetical protein VK424_00720 [Thermoplasmata archaeon]|nr:hypothetical protein [Thermoplasmata archaeon]
MKELEALGFLIGRWRGTSEDQFGVKGTLVSTMEGTFEPSEKFIQLRGENHNNGKLVNRAVQFITYDAKIRKYVAKRIWSMGFIENGAGTWDGKELVLRITFDCEPPFFRAMRWKSFIRRYTENEIGTGLFAAKTGGKYRLYGEARHVRIT